MSDTKTSSRTFRVTTELTDQRRGELALIILKNILRDQGVHLGKNEMRKVTKFAKETGIPLEEARAFLLELAIDTVVATLGPQDDHRGKSLVSVSAE